MKHLFAALLLGCFFIAPAKAQTLTCKTQTQVHVRYAIFNEFSRIKLGRLEQLGYLLLALFYIKQKDLYMGEGVILYQHKNGNVALFPIDSKGMVCAGIGISKKAHKAIIKKLLGDKV